MKPLLIVFFSYLTFITCDDEYTSSTKRMPSFFFPDQSLLKKTLRIDDTGTSVPSSPAPDATADVADVNSLSFSRDTARDTDVVASVRRYPSHLHKCSAVFIAPRYLLTTARCLYGENVTLLYVHSMSLSLEKGGQHTKVTAYFTHPKFEISPHVYDIGVLVLLKPVLGMTIPSLPFFQIGDAGDTVTYFQWKFATDLKRFPLISNKAKIVSNPKCSLILNEYIGCDTICAGDRIIALGPFDEGVPLTISVSNSVYVIGIYNRLGVTRSSMVETFVNIYYFMSWIHEKIPNIKPKTKNYELIMSHP